MVYYLKAAVITFISGLLTLFSPIQDILIGMVILLSINGLFGLIADIMDGERWHSKKALSFLYQCFIYFGLVMSLFVVGKFIHKPSEAATCVSMISIITTWVFTINILRNVKQCMPRSSPMYKLFDILHYIVSVQVIEKIPYVAAYMAEKQEEKRVEK